MLGSVRTSSSIVPVLALFAIGLAGLPCVLGAGDSYRDLVRHAETLDGTVLDSRQADLAINPASVVKIATTIWALERLGPAYRFETRFVTGGVVDPATGVLDGDLVVLGTGDPDFHRENAFLMALALNGLGIKTVRGDIRVDLRFWIGWEDGSSHRLEDPSARAELMASRLRSALDPHRWDRSTQKAWRELAKRRGIPKRKPPRVEVLGSFGPAGLEEDGRTLLVHHSKPLVSVLRRFNCYSNNDIERVAESLGVPQDLARMLADRWEVGRDAITFETASGLGTNRMTPRLVVRLVRDLVETCERLGLDPLDVLPSAGCDPGTLRMFPQLGAGELAGSVVAKTGSLVYTDGGVSVLAGIAHTTNGEVLFAVAMRRAGRKLHWARSREESWLIDLVEAQGGPQARACHGDLPLPDTGAEILVNGRASREESAAEPQGR